jgi:hypothetical protein
MGNRVLQLSPGESEELGRFCVALLETGESWIWRRNESVAIVDEATLQRQQIVDFSLDEITRQLPRFGDICEKVFGSGIYAAPLFILGKEPAASLAFELKDEGGRSLSPLSSEETGRISSAVLRVVCGQKLQAAGMSLTDELAEKLDQLARADAVGGEAWLERLRNPLEKDSDRAELEVLLDGDDLEWGTEWWLEALATGSLLLVTFEPGNNHRRVLKLSYDEQISRTTPRSMRRGVSRRLSLRTLQRWSLRLASRLAWLSFRFWVISPFITSSRYHLDVKAPPDFRLTLAELTYSGHRQPVRATGFRRRAHLYVNDAQHSRRGVARFGLRVSGRGVLGGAFAAAFLACAAISACMHFSKDVVEESGNMPALLLVLPGIIATYVARADQHGLTTRLLAIPRWILLIGAGIAAYYAAAVIALIGHVPGDLGPIARQHEVDSRSSSVELWLTPALIASGMTALIICVGWVCTRERTHKIRRWLGRAWRKGVRDRFSIQTTLRIPPETARAHAHADRVNGLLPTRKAVQANVRITHEGEYIASRNTGLVPWVHGIRVQKAPEGATVTWTYAVMVERKLRWLAGLLVFLEKRMALRQIRALQAGDL